jgi:hypothetical protein
MTISITIQARWDTESDVWLATSPDVKGLVVEAETWSRMINETRLVLPDLLDMQGQSGDVTLTFRAEEQRSLADA